MPAFSSDAEAIGKLPLDTVLSAKLGAPRQGNSHRLAWGAVGFLKRHMPESMRAWEHLSEDSIYQLIKAQIGYGEWYKLTDGREVFVPHSTAYDEATDEIEYRARFLTPALEYIAHSMGFHDSAELQGAMRGDIR